MKVIEKIEMTEKEYSDLCEYLEFKIKNPPICNNCPHFASWEKSACCGCPEEKEYEKKIRSFAGFELSKTPGLDKFLIAYEGYRRSNIRVQTLQNDLSHALKEYQQKVSEFESIKDNIKFIPDNEDD